MKRLNLNTAREDIRRLGIIISAAGLLAGVLEDTDLVTAGVLAISGLYLVWFGNLEDIE